MFDRNFLSEIAETLYTQNNAHRPSYLTGLLLRNISSTAFARFMLYCPDHNVIYQIRLREIRVPTPASPWNVVEALCEDPNCELCSPLRAAMPTTEHRITYEWYNPNGTQVAVNAENTGYRMVNSGYDHFHQCSRTHEIELNTPEEKAEWVLAHNIMSTPIPMLLQRHLNITLRPPQGIEGAYDAYPGRNNGNYDVSATFAQRYAIDMLNAETFNDIRQEFHMSVLQSNTYGRQEEHIEYRCVICLGIWIGTNNVGSRVFGNIPGMPQHTLVCENCVKARMHFCSNNNAHHTLQGLSFIHMSQPRDQSQPTRTAPPNNREGRYCCWQCAGLEEIQVGGQRCSYCGNNCTENSFNHEDIQELRASRLIPTLTEGYMICIQCVSCIFSRCTNCNRLAQGRNITRCNNCRANYQVRNYSYKPEPNFKPEAKPKTLFMGIELETCFSRGTNAFTWVERYGGDYFASDLFYIKSDGSLTNGVEIVTHPFTPEWGLEHFPFETFDSLVDAGIFLKNHSSSGQHIHISKDAFTAAHLWKFCMMHWNYKPLIEKIGGRTYNFSPEIAIPPRTQRTVTRNGWIILDDISEPVTDKERLTKSATAATKGAANRLREVALNLQNPQTIELRYPAGTAVGKEIKKNIQWIAAAFEFSKALRVEDIKEHVLADTGYLHGFIYDNNDKWPELASWIKTKAPVLAKQLPSIAKGKK